LPRLLNAVLVSAVIATALSGVGASTALGFGTVSSLNLHFHGQDREHERITRAALGCRAAWSIADPCFESIALDQLAGPDRDGLLMQSRGTVGEPDIRSFGDEKLHCDNADVRRVRAGAADDAPFRPYRDMDADHARAAASATLRICIELMRAHLDEGVTAAEHMIEDGHLKPGALADDYDDCFDGVFFALAFPKRKCTALLGLGQALHTAAGLLLAQQLVGLDRTGSEGGFVQRAGTRANRTGRHSRSTDRVT
jgi:hypothetical protein